MTTQNFDVAALSGQIGIVFDASNNTPTVTIEQLHALLIAAMQPKVV